jgi:hypothetical protein
VLGNGDIGAEDGADAWDKRFAHSMLLSSIAVEGAIFKQIESMYAVTCTAHGIGKCDDARGEPLP